MIKNHELIKEFVEKSKEKRISERGEEITIFNFYTFAKLIVDECVYINNEFGEDVENGNIFGSSEKKLGKDIKSGHLGPILWRASEKIKERFKND